MQAPDTQGHVFRCINHGLTSKGMPALLLKSLWRPLNGAAKVSFSGQMAAPAQGETVIPRRNIHVMAMHPLRSSCGTPRAAGLPTDKKRPVQQARKKHATRGATAKAWAGMGRSVRMHGLQT